MLHTPSIKAYKFWPGELGKWCTHAIVFARLIVEGNDYGVHAFISPIRDVETHETLPGIDVGDIGLKLGFQDKDNGFLGFDNFRIPRVNMLMRYTSLDKEGCYGIESDPKLIYAVLLQGRIEILKSAPFYLAHSLTIAIRYGHVRTQFRDKAGTKEERPLIEYQTHQHRIFP